MGAMTGSANCLRPNCSGDKAEDTGVPLPMNEG